MNAIINIFCFAVAFLVTWKVFKDRWGIKQLGVISIAGGLNFSFIYLCAKYFDVGFVLLPSKTVLFDPEFAMGMSVAMVKTSIFIFPPCYIFEWWYYKKNPDINPYTGKRKS